MGHVGQKFRLESVRFAGLLEGPPEFLVLPVELVPVLPQRAGRIGGDEGDYEEQADIHQHDHHLVRPGEFEALMQLVAAQKAVVFEGHHQVETDDGEAGDDEGQSAGSHNPDVDDEGGVDGEHVDRLDPPEKMDDGRVSNDFQEVDEEGEVTEEFPVPDAFEDPEGGRIVKDEQEDRETGADEVVDPDDAELIGDPTGDPHEEADPRPDVAPLHMPPVGIRQIGAGFDLVSVPIFVHFFCPIGGRG